MEMENSRDKESKFCETDIKMSDFMNYSSGIPAPKGKRSISISY